jgi:hypothetical protein
VVLNILSPLNLNSPIRNNGMSIGDIEHANREHASAIHNRCVTYDFHETSK